MLHFWSHSQTYCLRTWGEYSEQWTYYVEKDLASCFMLWLELAQSEFQLIKAHKNNIVCNHFFCNTSFEYIPIFRQNEDFPVYISKRFPRYLGVKWWSRPLANHDSASRIQHSEYFPILINTRSSRNYNCCICNEEIFKNESGINIHDTILFLKKKLISF